MRFEHNDRGQFAFDGRGQMRQSGDVQQLLEHQLQFVLGALVRPTQRTSYCFNCARFYNQLSHSLHQLHRKVISAIFIEMRTNLVSSKIANTHRIYVFRLCSPSIYASGNRLRTVCRAAMDAHRTPLIVLTITHEPYIPCGNNDTVL